MQEVLAVRKEPKLEYAFHSEYVNDNGTYRFLTDEELHEKSKLCIEYSKEIFKQAGNVVSSYIKIGHYLCKIKSGRLYQWVKTKSERYDDIVDFAQKVFGFSKSTTYNVMDIYMKFTMDGKLTDSFAKYSYSQLVELLKVDADKRTFFEPEMSVRDMQDLRKGWDKYGAPENVLETTWRKELVRVLDLAATEGIEAKKQSKLEKTQGLLSMLNGQSLEGTQESQESQEDVSVVFNETGMKGRTVFSLPTGLPSHMYTKNFKFSNDKERKDFISLDSAKKWPLYIEIPELKMEFRKVEFKNGASIIAQFGSRYSWNYKENKDTYWDGYFFRLHLQCEEKPEFDCAGTTATHIVEWLSKHKDEI